MRFARLLVFCAVFFYAFHLFAALDPFIRVHLLAGQSVQEVAFDGPFLHLQTFRSGKMLEDFLVPDETDVSVRALKVGLLLRLGNLVQKIDRLALRVPEGASFEFFVEDQRYTVRGALQVYSKNSELVLVERVPLETYVQAVLENTMPYGFPLEALKAQSILVRTFGLKYLKQSSFVRFDIEDQPDEPFRDYLYRQRALPIYSFKNAVQATRGVILTYEDQPIDAFSHPICGGHTSAAAEVFETESKPYLAGVDDAEYCRDAPEQTWKFWIDFSALSALIEKDKSFSIKGPISGFKLGRLEEKDGRVLSVKIQSKNKKKKEIAAERFSRLINRYLGDVFKSQWFKVEIKDEDLFFGGKGLGHGVGLCRFGAKGLAESGKNFDQILSHYFPSTALKLLW